ncbi:MAG: sulfotransferase domain-containing protein [Cyclobacteriaceae bacterium]
MIENGIFIIGVRKCGTTSLFNLLEQHPDIEGSSIKEPQFFSLRQSSVDANISYYHSLFSDLNGLIMDGSTHYFMHEHSIQNIRKYVRNPKFIIMIRNPVDRFFSAYFHLNRHYPPNDSRNLDQLVADYISLDPHSPIASENELISKLVSSETLNGTYYNKESHRNRKLGPMLTDYDDMHAEYRYLKESTYSSQLHKLDLNDSHIIVLEELLADSEGVISKLEKFLDLQSGYLDLSKTEKTNQGYVVQNPILGRFLRPGNWRPQLRLGIMSKIKKKFSKPAPKANTIHKRQIATILKKEFDFWNERLPQTKQYWNRYDKKTEATDGHPKTTS